jgi:hypothetical protein
MQVDPLLKLCQKHDGLKKLYWLADEHHLGRTRDQYGETLYQLKEEIFAITPTSDKTAVWKLREVISFADGVAGIIDPVEWAIEALKSRVQDNREIVAALKRLIPLAAMVDQETLSSFPMVRMLRQVIVYLSRPKLAARAGKQTPSVLTRAEPPTQKNLLEQIRSVAGGAA